MFLRRSENRRSHAGMGLSLNCRGHSMFRTVTADGQGSIEGKSSHYPCPWRWRWGRFGLWFWLFTRVLIHVPDPCKVCVHDPLHQPEEVWEIGHPHICRWSHNFPPNDSQLLD